MASALLEHDFSIQRGNEDILIVFFKGKVFCLPFFIFKSKKAATISGNMRWKANWIKRT